MLVKGGPGHGNAFRITEHLFKSTDHSESPNEDQECKALKFSLLLK